MKRLTFILLCFLSISTLMAQSPKREMRATWLATVWQIDWPASVVSSTGNTTQIAAQKNMMIRILDSLVSANMNAVCFQVRSRCDAMYNSAYEPWSTDLVAVRGQNPGYDPLQFVIDEGHKRGIEVHAWLNPYRYETVVGQWTGQAGDYRTAHPEWILSYSSGTCILDPGNPAVMKRIKQVVGDIIQKYDIDGLLFDDYFYAYGGTSATLDAYSQGLYKPAGMDVGDWRRANVNKMVAEVYDTIQIVKPHVRFGLSPFGIWTTNQAVAAQEGISLPEGITGGNMYAEIYCDPIAWLKQGKVDYVSPQLYWGTGGPQDYGKLCPWWSAISNRFGKQFYSSQDIAGLATSSYAPAQRVPKQMTEIELNGEIVNVNAMTQIERTITLSNPQKVVSGNFSQEEIGKQIGINRSSDENNAPGSIFFSTKQLYTTKGFINYLKKYQFTQKATVPAIDWKQHQEYGLVTNIALNANVLTWNSVSANARYMVYAIPNDKLNLVGNFKTSKYFAGISYTNSFTIPTSISTSTNTFAVAVLDKFGNEFAAQLMGQISKMPAVINLLTPANGESKIMPFNFTWQADATVEYYLFEVAEDAGFTKPICSRQMDSTRFSSTLLDALQSNKTYYWRIKTRKPNTVDGISEVRSFIPQRFSVLVPQSGATNVSLTPTIHWQNVNANNNYLIEISTSNQFTSNTLVYSNTLTTAFLTIPQKVLTGSSTYFVRVSTDILGVKTISNVVNFTTLEVIPSVPAFISPVKNSTVFGNEIKVSWLDGISTGYRVEMSNDIAFPVRNTTIKTVNAYIFDATYSGLTPTDYYFRVRAEYSVGLYTAWSDTLKVTLKNNTSISELILNEISCRIIKSTNSEIDLMVVTPESISANFILSSVSGSIINTATNQQLLAGSNKISIPVSDLQKGIYLIIIKSKTGQCVVKCII